MMAPLRVLAAEARRGVAAPERPLLADTLAGLGFSAPVIVALWSAAGPVPAVVVGVAVQLLAGYVVAGKLIRRG